MQLAAFIPNYDITMKHSIRIKASASNVYRAMKEVRFQEFSPVVHMLFALRAFPERLFKTDYPGITNKNNYPSNNPFFEQLFSRGFVILADNDELELVFGLIVPGEIGRFWRKSARASFRTSAIPRLAAAELETRRAGTALHSRPQPSESAIE